MRYSREYDAWATRAERNTLPSDRERAALTAAKIRDNHSGSSQDRAELARMEKLAGNSSSGWGWDHTPKKATPEKTKPEDDVILGMSEIVFTSDEFTFTDTFYTAHMDVALIERAISTYLAGRNDLDYSIHGFEDGGRLTKNTFTTKVKVSDYDPDNDKDFNDRSLTVKGRISQAKRRLAPYWG